MNYERACRSDLNDVRSWRYLPRLTLICLCVTALCALAACATTQKRSTPTPAEQDGVQDQQGAAGDTEAGLVQPEGFDGEDDDDEDDIDDSDAFTEQAAPKPTGIVKSARDSMAKGQYEDAISHTKSALRRNEKYVPAMVVMARSYYHLGKYEFTESICDIALGIDDHTGRCHNLKGFVALKNEDKALAKAHFEKTTQAEPGYGPGWLNLGAQYLEAKNYDSAIPALERAVELMPDRPEAHLNLGSAYRGAGELAKAQQSYDRALKLRPDYSAAYFNLGILYLDAEAYPGMSKLKQLEAAKDYLNRFKQTARFKTKSSGHEVDSYLNEADKLTAREQRRLKREERRKAREAAKKAEAAEAASSSDASADAQKQEGGAQEAGE